MKAITNTALTLIFFLLTAFSLFSPAPADGDKIEGVWLNQEATSKVQVVKLSSGSFAGKFYGRIVWLKVTHEGGSPRTDKNNPDVNKRKEPMMGLLVLKDLVYNASSKNWTGGTVYDPRNGKTYSCNITLKDDNTLHVRGYLGISLLGKTTVWTRTTN